MTDGPLQGAPDEGCRSGRGACDRTLRSALFCEFYAAGAGDSALSHWLFFAASRPLGPIAREDSNTGRSAARRQLETVRRSSEALAALVAGTLTVRLTSSRRARITRPLGFFLASTLDIVPFAGDLGEHQLQPFRQSGHFKNRARAAQGD